MQKFTPGVLLSVLTDEHRFTIASQYMRYIMTHARLPKKYLRETLQAEVDKQNITSLDKAWIALHVNRLLKDLDFH